MKIIIDDPTPENKEKLKRVINDKILSKLLKKLV